MRDSPILLACAESFGVGDMKPILSPSAPTPIASLATPMGPTPIPSASTPIPSASTPIPSAPTPISQAPTVIGSAIAGSRLQIFCRGDLVDFEPFRLNSPDLRPSIVVVEIW